MYAIRIHGRGGQGTVTAAELLSVAAFDEGKHAQAFPTFGSERTGAPVASFCRIDDRPIRLREPVTDPDAVLVQDPTLLHQVDLFAGLTTPGWVLRQHRAHARLPRPAGPGRTLLNPTTSSRCLPPRSLGSTWGARCPMQLSSERSPP